jgi:tetratricopeptide (TPR) repeat protein
MPAGNLLKLEDYRDRRLHRLARARALVAFDPTREALFEHLVEVGRLSSSERVAAVWMDEYGPGLVHPYLVVDTLCDRPRRSFSPEVLHRAWERGVPGVYDRAADSGSSLTGAFSIALGSDGERGWFVVAESAKRRAALDDVSRHRIMFLAGACSALVLHRDLDETEAAEDSGSFAGWEILRDLDGFESDESRSREVHARFLVGRLVRMLLEDDLVISAESRAEQAGAARSELGAALEEAVGEARVLEQVLEAYEAADLDGLIHSVVSMGSAAERKDHVAGALELYRCAYEVGCALGDVRAAVDAARASGRVLRRRASWEQADEWYGIALNVSRSAGMGDLAARSLAGLGLVRRERGNLPAARGTLEEALVEAEGSGDQEALASIHHDLMGLEQLSGDLSRALQHGWRALQGYPNDAARTRCMAGIAGVLIELGDWSAAEDAYTLVLEASPDVYYRVYALDGLAYVAALRGDASGYDTWTRRSDASGWEQGPASAKAEILCFRGVGCHALGRHEDATAWLERAVAFAESHGFSRVLFRAEAALEAVHADDGPATAAARGPAPPEVREGLRALRRASTLTGV